MTSFVIPGTSLFEEDRCCHFYVSFFRREVRATLGIAHAPRPCTRSFNIAMFVVSQMGQFYYAAKAFDVLERLDPNPEYWEGKRGSCVGIFQQIISGHEPRLYTLYQITSKPRK